MGSFFPINKRKRTDEPNWEFVNERSVQLLNIDQQSEIRDQMKLIRLTEDDLYSLAVLKPYIEKHSDEIMDAFYNHLISINHLKKIIEDHSTVHRLKQTLKLHIIEMFSGQIDEAYIKKRLRVASVHFKIGLLPKWYIGAFQQILEIIILILTKSNWSQENIKKAMLLCSKLINFETQLVLEEYEKENIRIRNAQYEQVKDELKKNMSLITANLAHLSEETNGSVKEVIVHSSEILRNTQQNIAQVNKIEMEATSGNHLMGQLEGHIENIAGRTEEMEELVFKLKDSSNKINQITSIVKQIADQTNHLAINASIEAARAGVHGKGFAVVAEEVRKLANESKQSVEQITKLIEESAPIKSNAVDTTKTIKEIVHVGLESSLKVKQAFTHIVDSVHENKKQIDLVGEDMTKLVEVIKEMNTYTSKVASQASNVYETTVHL